MSKGKRDARDAARAMMAAQKKAEARRKRMLFAGIGLGVVIIAAAIIVIASLNSGSKTSSNTTSAAPQSLVSEVTSVPAATLDKIGKGSGATGPKAVAGNAVRKDSDGKPIVFYMGAEYCPYCAGERWAMIVALSRFGTFKDLSLTSSSSTDVDPNTPTFSFHGATYTSQYLSFEPKEVQSNEQLANGSYASLDTLSKDEQAIVTKYDSGGSYPFVDFANQATISGASYDPGLLAGMSQQQVADQLKDPNSKIAQAIGGTANAMTAQLCKLTGNQPADVCSSAAVQAWANG